MTLGTDTQQEFFELGSNGGKSELPYARGVRFELEAAVVCATPRFKLNLIKRSVREPLLSNRGSCSIE